MPDITCSIDTHCDGAFNRESIAFLHYVMSGVNESNPMLQFDLSSLIGFTWASAQLRLTHNSALDGDPAIPPGTIYLAYILRPLVYTVCNRDIYDTGLDWETDRGEGPLDNDFDTRVVWPLSGSHVEDEQVFSPNITPILDKAIDENGAILNLIMYGTSGSNIQIQVYDSLETVVDPQPATLVISKLSLIPTAPLTLASGPARPAIPRGRREPRRTIRKGRII